MPVVDFSFRLKPVVQVASVSAAAVLPNLMRALSNLLLQAHILVHLKGLCVRFVSCFVFRIVKSSLESKAITAEPKDAGVTITRSVRGREQWMQRLSAAVLMERPAPCSILVTHAAVRRVK